MKASWSKRRRLWIFGLIPLVLILASWGTGRWISGKIESVLLEGLSERGLGLEWKESSWDPWRGTRFTGLRLYQLGEGRAAVAELDNLDLSIPITRFFDSEGRITTWQIDESPVTLHDGSGSVAFQQASLKLEVGNGEIVIRHVGLSAEGLTADLTGKIMVHTETDLPGGRFEPDLSTIRDILSTLDVRRGTGPFHVTGSFTVDATRSGSPWSAQLKGFGKNLEWKGVRYTEASVNAEITALGSEFRCELHTAHGSCTGVLTKPDWHDSPLAFEGILRDSAKRADAFHGSYQNGTFVVDSLEGDADLISIARDAPAIAVELPPELEFQSFPRIEARNIRKSKGSSWMVESLEVASKEDVQVTLKHRPLVISSLTARGSFDGREWNIIDSSANLLGGSLSLKGRYRDGIMRQSDLSINDILASELERLMEGPEKKPRRGVVSGRYQGAIDFRRRQLEGRGSLRMQDAPFVEVPLLDQVYELFASVVPGVERAGPGEFNADFKAYPELIEVTRFEAKGGSSLTVSAVGTIDLTRQKVSGRARGKLVGLPGLVIHPLSRLLEMEVAGPYDDIRVKPLGPAKLASNTASGTVGVAVDTLEEAGKITGTLLKEGVKLPFRWLKNQDDKE